MSSRKVLRSGNVSKPEAIAVNLGDVIPRDALPAPWQNAIVKRGQILPRLNRKTTAYFILDCLLGFGVHVRLKLAPRLGGTPCGFGWVGLHRVERRRNFIT